MPRVIPPEVDPGGSGGGSPSTLNPKSRVSLLVGGTMTKNALEAVTGTYVNSLVGNIASCRADVEQVKAILAVTNVTSMKIAPPVSYTMDETVPLTYADNIWGGRFPGSQTGYTGKGVIIGIVDTGIDLLHQDFRKLAADGISKGGPSRVVGGWDMTVTPGTEMVVPVGKSYGVEVTTAHIAAMLASGYQGIVIDGVPRPILKDTIGHGTVVTGIAAGNGTAPNGLVPTTGIVTCNYVGMAPEADILVVKLPDFPNTANVVDAVDFLFTTANNRNQSCVILLSVASREGQHDGFSDLDKQLEAAIAAQESGGHKGRHIVASAGNEGNSKRHYSFTFPTSPAGPHGFSLYPTGLASPNYPAGAASDSILMQGWVDATTESTVSVVTTYLTAGSSSNNTAVTATHGNEVTTTVNGTTVRIRNCVDGAINSKKKIEIYVINDGVTQTHLYGAMNISVSRTGGVSGTGTYDFYMVSSIISGMSQDKAIFVGTYLSYDSGITSPGSCLAALSVGGIYSSMTYRAADGSQPFYNFDPLGGMVPFSSKGPLLGTATIKPDLVAPATNLVTTLSIARVPAMYSYEKDRDLVHAVVDNYNVNAGGCSISAAFVAGAMALVIQRNGAQLNASMLTFFKTLMKTDRVAPGDVATQPSTPNNTMGNGKLWLQLIYGGSGVDPEPVNPPPTGGSSGGEGSGYDPPIIRDGSPGAGHKWMDPQTGDILHDSTTEPRSPDYVFTEPESATPYAYSDQVSMRVLDMGGFQYYYADGSYAEKDEVFHWNGFDQTGRALPYGAYQVVLTAGSRSRVDFIYFRL
jgi:hypothetical protein